MLVLPSNLRLLQCLLTFLTTCVLLRRGGLRRTSPGRLWFVVASRQLDFEVKDWYFESCFCSCFCSTVSLIANWVVGQTLETSYFTVLELQADWRRCSVLPLAQTNFSTRKQFSNLEGRVFIVAVVVFFIDKRGCKLGAGRLPPRLAG